MLICFPRITIDILLPSLMTCMAGIWYNKPYCDITVVATRVIKEKQSGGHLAPRCSYTCNQDTLGDNFERLHIDSFSSSIINLVSP